MRRRNPRTPSPLLLGRSMIPNQRSLFGPSPALPAGFRYKTDLVSPGQKRDLLERWLARKFTSVGRARGADVAWAGLRLRPWIGA